MKTIHISTKTTQHGFQTIIDKKKFKTSYSHSVWEKILKETQTNIAQTVSYFVTRHLALATDSQLSYGFPPPQARLFFDYGFQYSMAEAPFEFPEKKLTTGQVIRSVYNSDFSISFNQIVPQVKNFISESVEKDKMIMPISFGKDSLLTFALSREMGLKAIPFFFEEPACEFQNKKKDKSIKEFQREFNLIINKFTNSLGNLRQANGMMWGWDMLLLQYTTLLLPYVFYNRPEYFLWSNEQSTNENQINKEGYIINSTHEQSVQWTLNLTNLFRIFGLNTTACSLLEPVHELLILSILHKRYPEIGKYQLSCDGEKTKHRWCGSCFECARVYLFFCALGIDPKRVGLMTNMLDANKRNLYYLFSKKNESLDIVFQSYPERLLAFYMASKRGVKGALIDEFNRKLLSTVEKQKEQLFSKYFGVHKSLTITKSLQKPLYKIYNQEQDRLKKEVMQFL